MIEILNNLGQTLMMSMGDSPKRRSFFTTSEELYDDEYYDEQTPDQKKRRLTQDQVTKTHTEMEKLFQIDIIYLYS